MLEDMNMRQHIPGRFSESLLDDLPLETSGTVGLEVTPPPRISETRTSFSKLADRVGHLRARTRLFSDDVTHLHQEAQLEVWSERARDRAKSSTQELLAVLSGLGFAWRDIARMAGVSVPAVQKWRRGESSSGESRYRLAQTVALCDMLSENYLISDVASWCEVPIHSEAPLTALDLIAGTREELVIEHAAAHTTAESILDRFDPEWRQRYRSDFEVFVAPDDQISIRRRNSDG